MDYQSVLDEVESWPVDDRVRLVHDLWDRLVGEGYEREITPEMKAELDRRIDELDRDPGVGIPWDQVKARALGQIGP
jgi:putative addiction module component (TIGR02574 family)